MRSSCDIIRLCNSCVAHTFRVNIYSFDIVWKSSTSVPLTNILLSVYLGLSGTLILLGPSGLPDPSGRLKGEIVISEKNNVMV